MSKLPSFVAPCDSKGYKGAGALDRFPVGQNRKAAEFFYLVAFSAENRRPPRIKSGAGIFRKML
jgi:hypothetical protein